MAIKKIYNETVLIEAINRGQEEAFTEIYWHYSPQVYLKVLNMVKDQMFAEEVVQELFTRIWAMRDKITAEQNFSGLLNTIATNLVLDLFRKIKKDRNLYGRLKIVAEEHYSNIEDALFFKESESLLQEAVATLAPQQKRVFQLCKLEGMTYKEAAGLLGISHFTVKEYLVEANRNIRTFIMRNSDKGLVLWLMLVVRQIV